MLAEVQAHAAADHYRTGAYWDGSHGCTVGCSLHSAAVLTGDAIDASDHTAFPSYLGIPEQLARLQDWCFEHLPAEARATWPVDFIVAIPDGADLEPSIDRILARILREVVLPVAGGSAGIVERVATGLETNWANDDRAAATTAAWAAAWAAAAGPAAAAAARAAAWAAEAAAAAWAAGAAEAARSAAGPAAAAAESVTQSIAQILLAEMRKC